MVIKNSFSIPHAIYSVGIPPSDNIEFAIGLSSYEIMIMKCFLKK